MDRIQNDNMRLLRTSRAVAIRAAEWGTHKLGGEIVLTAGMLGIAASCMVIAQFILQWIHQKKMSRERVESILMLIPKTESDEKERKTLIEFSITRGIKAGIPEAEAEKSTRYVLQVLTADDVETARTSHSRSV